MAESLRDQLEANYDKIVPEGTPETPTASVETPAVTPVATEAKTETPSVEAPDKPGRTAGRERDDQGRLLPGAAKKPEVVATPAVAPIPEVKRPQRPSSWKKDFWPHWETLDPKLADYIHQRESEYAKGVSTYKGEWENAKPLLDVVQSHSDVIQQTGLQPAQWINELGTAHRMLTQGTPEQKLNTVLNIALNNGVDLRKLGEKLFFRGEDGQLYMNQNLRPAQQPQPQQQPDVRKQVSAILAEERANQEIASMKSDTEKYPHFEAVRQTMLGLLQGGLAQDLPSAYQASIRLPQHSEIWDAIQEQKRTQEDSEKRAKEAARVASAKAAAVSPKGATPTGTPANGKKGLRATIEAAVDEHAGAGRV